MGTTATPHVGLIKPDSDELMPNWVTQYEANLDKLDETYRIPAVPESFTPEFTADTTNPTLGTGGYIEGRLWRIWPWLALVKVRMYAGTAGFAGGSGTWRIKIPDSLLAAPDPDQPVPITGNKFPCGYGYLHDFTTSNLAQTCTVGMDLISSSYRFMLGTEHAAATSSVQGTVPFTWTNEDKFTFMAVLPIGGFV